MHWTTFHYSLCITYGSLHYPRGAISTSSLLTATPQAHSSEVLSDSSRSSAEPPSSLAGAVFALLLRSSAFLAISTVAKCRLTSSGELVTIFVVDRRSSWPSRVRTSNSRLSILRTRCFPRWPSSKDRSRTCLRGLKFLFYSREQALAFMPALSLISFERNP